MNASCAFRRALPPRLVALAAALAFAGCVTQQQVQSIVNSSNYEMLTADAGAPTDVVPADGKAAATPTALARLDAFIQQHPDDPAMLNALRLRRALLYLNNHSFALATTAFAEIDATQLHTARDRALYDARDTMIWWWQNSQNNEPGVFTASHRSEAEAHMRDLLRLAGDVSLPPDLRDYLLEMRAWIGVKLGLDIKNYDEGRVVIEDAVNAFAHKFSDAENQQLAAGRLPDGAKPYDPATRRLLRAQGLLDYLASKIGARAADKQPQFENAGWRAYYDHACHPHP